MADYTIFVVDRENQTTSMTLAAGLTAEDALAKAAEMVNDHHGAEIWKLAKLVATLEPRDRS